MSTSNITVAVPTLDRPEKLARCVNAVLAGARLPAEVVVVDQSRDDATESFVKGLRHAAIPVVYVRKDPRGLSAARNSAVRHSRNPILAFTDDDCVPGPNWIGAIDDAFAQSPQLGAVAGSVLPLGEGTSETFSISPRTDDLRAEFASKTIPWRVGTGGNMAIRREWLERIGGYDERLGAGSPGKAAEDADLIYKLLGAGARIRYEPDALVYHERQSKERRLASRWSYGYGIGAFCGMWLRRGDRYVVRALASWLFGLAREGAGNLARGQWLEVRQRLLSVGGTLSGLRYGLRAERQNHG